MLHSAAQYETQLKKWRARKNFKGHEWKIILHHLEKFRAQDKRVTVYNWGHPVSELKIRNARRHCVIGHTNARTGGGKSSLFRLNFDDHF